MNIDRPSKETMDRLQEAYLNSDKSWEAVLSEEKLLKQKTWISNQISLPYLIKIRRINKQKAKMSLWEQKILNEIEEQKKQLNVLETSLTHLSRMKQINV